MLISCVRRPKRWGRGLCSWGGGGSLLFHDFFVGCPAQSMKWSSSDIQSEAVVAVNDNAVRLGFVLTPAVMTSDTVAARQSSSDCMQNCDLWCHVILRRCKTSKPISSDWSRLIAAYLATCSGPTSKASLSGLWQVFVAYPVAATNKFDTLPLPLVKWPSRSPHPPFSHPSQAWFSPYWCDTLPTGFNPNPPPPHPNLPPFSVPPVPPPPAGTDRPASETAGAEEHSLAKKDALPHHWAPSSGPKGGACGVQAHHRQPAAGRYQGGAPGQARPA